MIKKLIEENYGFTLKNLKHLESHFATEIYIAETDFSKYIIKKLPAGVSDLENKGEITSFLTKHGISVARLIRNLSGKYVVQLNEFQLTVQNFIEGSTWSLNSATPWFMEKSAQILGGIHSVLKK